MRATTWTGSSASASRARIRRTSASPLSLPWRSAEASASTRICRSSRARRASSSACADVRSRALPPPCGAPADCDLRPRARHRHHRRVPGGDRGGLRPDARGGRGGPLRERVHLHLLAPVGDGGGHLPDQVPDEVKHERLERLVDVVQRIAAERNAERVGRVEEVLVEGPSRTDPSLLRGRSRRNTTVNLDGAADRGALVDVLVQSSTSTTLRGRALAAVSA